jgi:hypothetical protein
MPLPYVPSAHGFSRRRLVQLGAAGAATVWFGGFERLGRGIAAASSAPAPLRRSSYTFLSERTFEVDVEGISHALELVAAEDLPVADTVPSLQGLDDAFALHFTGAADGAFAGGTREIVHPELGTFTLFLAPVEQHSDAQSYEAIIDRTVRIPGLNDDGSPAPVDPPRRRELVIRNRRRKHKRRHHR